MKISVIGLGYVGVANALLLALKNEILAYDIDSSRVDALNLRKAIWGDEGVARYLQKNLNLKATKKKEELYHHSNFFIIAIPTNYDEVNNTLDTTALEQCLFEILKHAEKPAIFIRSTIPVGFVEQMRTKFKWEKIFFSPEFLREGTALEDNLNPSRIVVGGKCEEARKFAKLLQEGSKDKKVPVFFTSPREAEAIKLFANTYLAMRVAYFNELDTYALKNNLESKEIIAAVCADSRIGKEYNNPSFGYGGYCLPKDTRQLLASYQETPQSLIKAIVDSNATRKNFLADVIYKKDQTIGIYRLLMKTKAHNFRSSSLLDVMKKLKKKATNIFLFEPLIAEDSFQGVPVVKNFQEFVKKSDVIITNRWDEKLSPCKEKVFSRDLFGNN